MCVINLLFLVISKFSILDLHFKRLLPRARTIRREIILEACKVPRLAVGWDVKEAPGGVGRSENERFKSLQLCKTCFFGGVVGVKKRNIWCFLLKGNHHICGSSCCLRPKDVLRPCLT